MTAQGPELQLEMKGKYFEGLEALPPDRSPSVKLNEQPSELQG